MKRYGFTLLELLIALAVGTSMIIALLQFLLILERQRVREIPHTELQQEVRIAAERIAATIRHAQEISVANSRFGTGSGVLSLIMSGAALNPTLFSLSGGAIVIREGVGAPTRLTSPDIRITELRFQNLTASGTYGTVHVSLRGNDRDVRFADTVAIETDVSLRQ